MREQLRARCLSQADAGEDPAQERADRKVGRYTCRELADEVLHARAMRTRKATRREVVHLVEGTARRGTPVVANRTLSLVRLIFNDGMRRGFPTLWRPTRAHLVELPAEETGRDRYLTREEIRVVWHATGDETRATRGAFRLGLLTGQRIGSVCAMRWDGITGDLWTIPAEHFKGKRTHLVPLSVEALQA